MTETIIEELIYKRNRIVSALGFDNFISLVVFSTNAKLKVHSESDIIYTVNLKKTISGYQKQFFTTSQVTSISKQIRKINNDSKNNRREHIQSIQMRVQNVDKNISQGKCPKCGGLLLVRKGKYGFFTGCSNFPKCRFTINSK